MQGTFLRVLGHNSGVFRPVLGFRVKIWVRCYVEAGRQLDSPSDVGFDRFTRLVAEVLHVPVALFTIVTPERQVLKSTVGVGELRESREWKASGCFLCAAAYLGTATVALVNGVPLVFQQ